MDIATSALSFPPEGPLGVLDALVFDYNTRRTSEGAL